jgi:hypothetical protein
MRLPVGDKTVRRGRDLGAYMQPRAQDVDSDMDWEEFHSIRGILTHTASSAFLRAERQSPNLS